MHIKEHIEPSNGYFDIEVLHPRDFFNTYSISFQKLDIHTHTWVYYSQLSIFIIIFTINSSIDLVTFSRWTNCHIRVILIIVINK